MSTLEEIRAEWHYLPGAMPPPGRVVLLLMTHQSEPVVMRKYAVGSWGMIEGHAIWSITGEAPNWGWYLIGWASLPPVEESPIRKRQVSKAPMCERCSSARIQPFTENGLHGWACLDCWLVWERTPGPSKIAPPCPPWRAAYGGGTRCPDGELHMPPSVPDTNGGGALPGAVRPSSSVGRIIALQPMERSRGAAEVRRVTIAPMRSISPSCGRSMPRGRRGPLLPRHRPPAGSAIGCVLRARSSAPRSCGRRR